MTRRIAGVCITILGLTFVASGFVKGVDPHGTEYRIVDYAQSFGMSWMSSELALAGSCLLSAFEFVLGCCLLSRVRFRLASAIALCTLSAMTPFTLWLALYNPVSDCGCFGDALVLTNWQTFWKNVFLLALCIVSCCTTSHNSKSSGGASARNVLPPSLAFVAIVSVQAYSLYDLPLFDFRPYRVGSDIRRGMSTPPDAPKAEYKTEFIFEKNGERREFSLKNYPDTSWALVESNVKMVRPGYVPPIHDFSIVRVDDHLDMTDSILSLDNVILIFLKDLDSVDYRYAHKLNALEKECSRMGANIYAITASTSNDINKWVADTHAHYTFCYMDPTTIKTIIRSNPGILLLKRGVVKHKWSRNNIPQKVKL